MLYDPLAHLVQDIESDRLRRRAELLRRDPELVWNLEASNGDRRHWRLPAWLGWLRPARVAAGRPASPAESTLGAPAPPSLGNP